MANAIRQPGTALLAAVLALCSGAAFAASAEREAIDLSTRGPQVGEALPAFELPDQDGRMWTSESILGPNGTMLVFIRSADW